LALTHARGVTPGMPRYRQQSREEASPTTDLRHATTPEYWPPGTVLFSTVSLAVRRTGLGRAVRSLHCMFVQHQDKLRAATQDAARWARGCAPVGLAHPSPLVSFILLFGSAADHARSSSSRFRYRPMILLNITRQPATHKPIGSHTPGAHTGGWPSDSSAVRAKRHPNRRLAPEPAMMAHIHNGNL